jgi:hypothetical protein
MTNESFRFHFSENFRADDEVQVGLIEIIERIYPDRATQFKIDAQLEMFKRLEGTFGLEMVIHSRDKKQLGMMSFIIHNFIIPFLYIIYLSNNIFNLLKFKIIYW